MLCGDKNSGERSRNSVKKIVAIHQHSFSFLATQIKERGAAKIVKNWSCSCLHCFQICRTQIPSCVGLVQRASGMQLWCPRLGCVGAVWAGERKVTPACHPPAAPPGGVEGVAARRPCGALRVSCQYYHI